MNRSAEWKEVTMNQNIRLVDVSKLYGTSGGGFPALKHVNLTIPKGEICAIVGASGAGKTTLLNVMSCLTDVTEGEIYFDDTDITKMNGKEASDYRLHNIGFVFQKYQLMPTLNIHDNICLPYVLAKESVDEAYVTQLVQNLGIESELEKMPDQLSGGQQQRVAIARALALKPSVIFADEPTGNLDSQNGFKTMDLLISCAKELGHTLVFVTHNETLAAMADRKIEIVDGEIA